MSESINNYDDERFFSEFQKQDVQFAAHRPGHDLFYSMLPDDITGWTILDLCCGNGSFGRRVLDKNI